MRSPIHYLLACFAFCFFFLTTEGVAQESTYPAMEETDTEVDNDRDEGTYVPLEREKNQYVPGSEGGGARTGVYNDASANETSSSVTTKPVSANEKQPAKNEADESVLGFNFLYYIIQKFKMSEIADK